MEMSGLRSILCWDLMLGLTLRVCVTWDDISKMGGELASVRSFGSLDLKIKNQEPNQTIPV